MAIEKKRGRLNTNNKSMEWTHKHNIGSKILKYEVVEFFLIFVKEVFCSQNFHKLI